MGLILQIQIGVSVCDEDQMWTFSSLSLQVSVMTFKQKVAHLAPDTDALWFFKCTGSDSPSLLLQEKPKQRRKTNTKEIHIMATDALADLVKSGGSSENKQWQESKGETSSWMKTWEMITDSPEWSSASPLPVLIVLS